MNPLTSLIKLVPQAEWIIPALSITTPEQKQAYLHLCQLILESNSTPDLLTAKFFALGIPLNLPDEHWQQLKEAGYVLTHLG